MNASIDSLSLLDKTAADVPTLLAAANSLGEIVNTLAKVDGCFYFSSDSCLTRLTLGTYKATNYLEPWTYSNKLLSALYVPDQYKYLKLGDAALEFVSDHKIEVTTSPLIDITGGFDEYLTRIPNKRRNEVRKIKKDSAGCKITKTLSSKNLDELSGLAKFMTNLFDSSAQHNNQLPSIDSLFTDYKYEVYSALFCYNLLFRGAKYYDAKDYEIFVLALTDTHGEVLCETLCLSAYDNYVLHLFVDTNKSENYTAKQATLNQLLWAIENGFSYIDVSNETVDKTSSPRVTYKKLFYTEPKNIPAYYTDSFGLETYKSNQAYNDPLYSLPCDSTLFEDHQVQNYYGVSKSEIENRMNCSLLCSLTVPEAQGLLYFISNNRELYEKPTPVLLWNIFPFYSQYKVGDKITGNLQVAEKGFPLAVLSLHDKTPEQIDDWVRGIKTKNTYTMGTRYKELEFNINKQPVNDLSEFENFLYSNAHYIEPKAKNHDLTLEAFVAEESFLYRVFDKRQIPIVEIVTFECSVKGTEEFIFYGYGYVSQGILYATFMYVTQDSDLRKRYSPALVYHSALPRYVKQHYPKITKINFSELFAYKHIFNFELEYGIGLELIQDNTQ